jgi:hypothetical protein
MLFSRAPKLLFAVSAHSGNRTTSHFVRAASAVSERIDFKF